MPYQGREHHSLGMFHARGGNAIRNSIYLPHLLHGACHQMIPLLHPRRFDSLLLQPFQRNSGYKQKWRGGQRRVDLTLILILMLILTLFLILFEGGQGRVAKVLPAPSGASQLTTASILHPVSAGASQNACSTRRHCAMCLHIGTFQCAQ